MYRKLRQHVAAFRAWVRDRDDGDLLAAKLMGRWPSGAPVALAADADDPALAADPVARQPVRLRGRPARASPARAAPTSAARARATATRPTARRLLLRRGLPYGDAAARRRPGRRRSRGLVGFFLNASIERQFEFVQRKWIN